MEPDAKRRMRTTLIGLMVLGLVAGVPMGKTMQRGLEAGKGSNMLDTLPENPRLQLAALAAEQARAREALRREHEAEIAAWRKQHESEKAQLRPPLHGGKALER